jgi:hypothetical protein
MRILGLATAIVATSSLIGFSLPASAWPDLSYATFTRSYSSATCLAQAKAAFLSIGWTNAHPSGEPSFAIAAENEKLSAVIMCIGGSEIGSLLDCQIIVTVAGGSDDMGSNLRDQLANYMKR